MSVKIFLSGGEVPRFYDCMRDMQSKSVLMTYWSLKKNPDYLKRRKDENPDINIMVDSGAFTFFTKGWQKPISYYEKYVHAYRKFLQKNKDYIFAAAELDIDNIVGEIAQKWREDIFEKIDRKVVPIIFVWHDGWHKAEDFKFYCKRYPYVGIASSYKGNYNPLQAIARQYLTKVHVFGYTRSTEIQEYDFYSVDSTTWLLGSKYGETDIFNGKTISRFDNTKKKDVRRQFRTKFENAGLDWKKIEQEEYYEVIKMNMMSFIEMEEYLARANKLKAYWTKRFPRASKIKSLGSPEIDNLLKLHGFTEPELKDLNPSDKRERATLFANLQNNRYKSVQEWLNQNPEDAGIVFTEEAAAKVKDKSKATLEEIDDMRKTYNLGLLQSGAAKKRLGPEDFKPAFVTQRREQEPEEVQVQAVDPEAIDMFYGEGS